MTRGFEPLTSSVTGWRSNRLNYATKWKVYYCELAVYQGGSFNFPSLDGGVKRWDIPAHLRKPAGLATTTGLEPVTSTVTGWRSTLLN